MTKGTDLTELIFGLVGALGADLRALHESLEEALMTVGFHADRLKLIEWVERCDNWKGRVDPEDPFHKQAAAKIDIGNEFCAAFDVTDGGKAFAMMAVAQIRDRRVTVNKDLRRGCVSQTFYSVPSVRGRLNMVPCN